MFSSFQMELKQLKMLSLLSGQTIDFATDTISTDYESTDTHRSVPLKIISTEAIRMVTLMPPSNLTSSTTPSTKKPIRWITLKTLVITAASAVISVVLLLLARKYFNARKSNSSQNTSNTHSIKYISNKQINKIHIDMSAEDALNYGKERIESSECEGDGNGNAMDVEHKQINTNGNIFNRVKRQLCRPTLLAAAATTPRYRNLDKI